MCEEKPLHDALTLAARREVQTLPSFDEFRIQKAARQLRDLSSANVEPAERRQKFAAAAVRLRDEVAQLEELERALTHSVQDRGQLRPEAVRLNEGSRLEVRCKLAYFEFQLTCMGMTATPDTIQKLNTVQYCVENNLPVERQLLYEVCPEMFSYELEDMDEVARRKMIENAVRLEFSSQGELGSAPTRPQMRDEHEQLMHDHLLRKHKLMRLLEKRMEEQYEALVPFLTSNFHDERKFTEFLDLLMDRAPEQLVDPNERAIHEMIRSGREMMADMRLAEEKFAAETDAMNQRIEMPYFVYRHAKLREFWVQRHAECVVPMDISECILMPRSKPTPDLIEEEMTPAERKALEWSTRIAPGPIAPQLRDHSGSEKNEERVMRAQVMGEVLNRVADGIKSGRVQLEEDESEVLLPPGEEELLPLRFQAGRISFEELERCLVRNNSDPSRYSLAFFADYFDLPIEKLRLIFNCMALPIIADGRVRKVHRFFSDLSD